MDIIWKRFRRLKSVYFNLLWILATLAPPTSLSQSLTDSPNSTAAEDITNLDGAMWITTTGFEGAVSTFSDSPSYLASLTPLAALDSQTMLTSEGTTPAELAETTTESHSVSVSFHASTSFISSSSYSSSSVSSSSSSSASSPSSDASQPEAAASSSGSSPAEAPASSTSTTPPPSSASSPTLESSASSLATSSTESSASVPETSTSPPPAPSEDTRPPSFTRPAPTPSEDTRPPSTTRPTPLPTRPPMTTATSYATRRPVPPDAGQRPQEGIGTVCDFGRFGATSLCEWFSSPEPTNVARPHGRLAWRAGAGPTSNWIGGPHSDASGDIYGGYAFVETSEGAGKDLIDREPMATLLSPTKNGTGVHGSCLSFRYQMKGLSAGGLRISMITPAGSRELWYSATPTPPGWHRTHLLFTNHGQHQVAVQALATDGPGRSYRGHIAIDDLSLRAGPSCAVSCTFAAGFCDWTNEEGDDFDWTLGIGSSNPATGPSVAADIWAAGNVEAAHADLGAVAAAASTMSEVVATSYRRHPGGYAYIDSSFPRRPGDAARLVSSQLPASDPTSPWCLRFWFHMWGPGVAALRVILRPSAVDLKPKTLWEMNGDSSNTWFRGAVTLSSSQPFQVILEATVGAPDMGDIAIDDISLGQGPCPVSPQVAGRDSVDCSFELDECAWRPPASTNRAAGESSSDLWERVAVKTLKEGMRRQPHGPTLRNDYFLRMKKHQAKSDGSLQPVAILTTALPAKDAYGRRCLSFWYLLTEMSADESSLGPGLLQVAVRRVSPSSKVLPAEPVWQMFGQQGPHWQQARVPISDHDVLAVEIHGQWSSIRTPGIIAIDDIVLYHGACSALPAEATAEPQDCSFESGPCAWHNYTDGTYPSDPSDTHWQLASMHHRPADLMDATFHAPGGYVFFDMWSLSGIAHRSQLRSPVVQGRAERPTMCVSFWYAAFGAGDTTRLRLVRRSMTNERLKVWELAAKGLDTSRPQWYAAQVSMDSTTNFTLLLEGEASNGGFAVDDLRLRPGKCETRPERAAVLTR